MKIIKPLTLGLLQKPYRYLGRDYLVISALGFFTLGKPNSRFLTENLQWQRIVPQLPPGQPLDEVMPKTRGEVLLAGSAFAPDGVPVTQMQVRLQLGPIDKRLVVTGERNWMYSLLPLYQIAAPQAFTGMPLSYQRAYGGPNYAANLLGCGYTGKPLGPLFGQNQGSMPNLAYPGQAIKSPLKRYAPAGFGPLDLSWSPRKDKHGTFDQDWLNHHAPGLAKDVNWDVFNTAPQDQWQAGFWQGGESYCLEGMHPQLPLIQGQLPQFQVRAFVLMQGQTAQQAMSVAMQLDTVWFFPELQTGVLIYHGQTAINDIDAQDVAAIMLGYENDAKPLQHYLDVFALRLAPESAALHAFNESQLAPQRSSREQAQRSAVRQQEAANALTQQQALLDEMEQDFWQQAGIEPLPGHVPAQAQPPALPALSQIDINDGDFDLSQIVVAAQALAEAAKQDGDAKLAQLPAQLADLPEVAATPEADLASQQQAALALASVPAYDLMLPAQQNAPLPDNLAELLQAMELAGDAVSADQRASVKAALLQQTAHQRQGRRAALRPTAPAQPMPAAIATWLGQQVAQWQGGGAFLAGRDLAGLDLRGIDFSGADLREVMLEQCQLDGANFSHANLSGAVLSGASLHGANFSHANLSHANLCVSRGEKTCFAHADLRHAMAMEASWPGANLQDAQLADCTAIKINLSAACLDRADLSRSNFLEATADASSWQQARLEQTILLKASLQHANFNAAEINKAVFMDSDLRNSSWQRAHLQRAYGGGKTDFSAADFSHARGEMCGFHGATFCAANFTCASFVQSDFGSCDMRRARLVQGLFSGSLFMNGNLSFVDAQDADFFRALGRKTNFSSANLRAANLVQVDLTGAIFDDACLEQVLLEAQRRVA